MSRRINKTLSRKSKNREKTRKIERKIRNRTNKRRKTKGTRNQSMPVRTVQQLEGPILLILPSQDTSMQ